MARILLPINEPLFRPDGRLAGLQIRVFEMSRALARKGHAVTVAQTGSDLLSGNIPGVTVIDARSIRSADYDWCIAHPFVIDAFRASIEGIPLVYDGYEFPFASFFSQAASMIPRAGQSATSEYRRHVNICLRGLQNADAVIAANTPQRMGYMALMCGLGLLNPEEPDPGLILQVHAGAPPDPLPKAEALGSEWQLRQNGPVILWLAGTYAWFDEDTYLKSMHLVVNAIPDVQFLFVGLDGRDGAASPIQLPGAISAYERIMRDPALASRSIFVPWTVYATRGDAYVAADIAVATHKRGVETLYSTRTRVVDFIWARLPSVISTGDSLSGILVQRNAAIGVEPENVAALADGIISLLKDPVRQQELRENLDALAKGELSWDHQIEELHSFLSETRPRRRSNPRDYEVMRLLPRSELLKDSFKARATQVAKKISRIFS